MDLTTLIAAALVLQPGVEMRMMRMPDIHGDQVVFSYANDLWTADRSGGFARRLTSHPGQEGRAHFSPDGKWIAFTGSYEGNPDIYVMPAEGGEPKRLTFEAGADICAGWTRDGKIAYTTSQNNFTDRMRRLHFVKPTGGLPEATNLFEVTDLSFSPDGTKMAYTRMDSHAFNWRRYRGGTQGFISIWDWSNNTYSELPHGREQSYLPQWVGDSIYYISDKTQGTLNLWRYDTKSKRATQVTNYADADLRMPNSDGKTLIFERDGYLWTHDPASSKTEKFAPRLVDDMLMARPALRELGGGVNATAISPTGARVAVISRGELFSVPARNGETRNMSKSSGAKESNPVWSPDGKTIAYLSDASGEVRIMMQPQMGGEAKMLATDPSHRIRSFNYSPDSKLISYTTADGKLVVCDANTGRGDVVYQARFGDTGSFDWSPDSKWIAYVEALPNLQGAIFLYNVASKKSTQVTEGYYSDSDVSFDLSGKYLYFTSMRTILPRFGQFEFQMDTDSGSRVYLLPLTKDQRNPLLAPEDEEPVAVEGGAPRPPAGGPPAGGPPSGAAPARTGPEVKIDFEGLAERALPLPWPPGNYGILGLNNGLLAFVPGQVLWFNFQSRQSIPIYQGPISAISFNPDRTRMAFNGPTGLAIANVGPGIDPNAGRVNTNNVEAIINPREEWKQIFWEAWRWQRDEFYDPKMLGLDWLAIGKRYEKYLEFVNSRADLNVVLGLMIGELGTGHAYVGGGDPGPAVNPGPPVPTGMLGADYEVKQGKIAFKKIYRGLNFEEGRRGPLGEPGANLKEGDFLLAIDGVALDASKSPSQLLVNKVGRSVTLTVNDKPSMEGARKVKVRPLADESELRYIEWVEGNRRYVAEKTNGRIGYLHVPDTSIPGVIEFLKGYYSQSDKEALIIDERYNGGGMIPTFYIEKLVRTTTSGFRGRYGADVFFPQQTPEGPKAMLVNSYAGSGGDLFPWLFKEAKIGPLIGTRTWGGLVGIQGSAPLVDGGFLTSPAFGIYDFKSGKWIAENTGVDPDIEVDMRPDDLAKGVDAQLDRAIKHLMDQLAKGPRPVRKAPEFPVAKPPVR